MRSVLLFLALVILTLGLVLTISPLFITITNLGPKLLLVGLVIGYVGTRD